MRTAANLQGGAASLAAASLASSSITTTPPSALTGVASARSGNDRHRSSNGSSSISSIGNGSIMSNPSISHRSTGTSRTTPRNKKKSHKALPPLFWYMEMGEWEKATERAKQHPREVKTWATLKTKSMAEAKVSGTKRLALHHACFKLRSVVPNSRIDSTQEDGFVEVCRFIMLLVSLYPDAAGERESRHGCLPLHLAAFASCAPRNKDDDVSADAITSSIKALAISPSKAGASADQSSSSSSAAAAGPNGKAGGLSKPSIITSRSISESTSDTTHTNMTAIMAEERFTNNQTAKVQRSNAVDFPSARSVSQGSSVGGSVSVSFQSNMLISEKREEMAVQVINALLDAYPRGIRVDSEGGRLPLHTACAGRATPRVITTLLTAYPSAARHRNKDGFLPLHLAAHWGVSHPNVAIAMLKAYPDSTLGRNRWERTPLEEALCMAGENGRPHQAALVRALRKHPSYWTRPPEELFRLTTGRMEGTNLVDIDETLPDDDTTTQEEEEIRYLNGESKFLNGMDYFNRLLPPSGTSGRSAQDMNVPLGSLINRQNWVMVAAKLETNPQIAGETLTVLTRGGYMATEGLTPLHYACERNPPLEAVEALIAAWPEALTTRMQPGGALPLHTACTWNASAGIVAALCRAEPAACRIPDDLGNVPLHCACFSGALAPVADTLLQTYGKAVLARNHQGSLPIDIVKRLRHESRRSVMTLLIKHKEDIISSNQHRRSQSSGSFGVVAEKALEMTNDKSLKVLPEGPQECTDGDEGKDVDLNAGGVEVSYEEGEGEMMWI